MSPQQSPLAGWHLARKARMVEFAGWELPVQFSSVMEEHKAVRSRAGLFDISHMAQVLVAGPGSSDFLQKLFTNDLSRLSDGSGQYTHMCNEAGGVIDDLFVFRLSLDQYFVVMNASREQADLDWMRSHLQPGVALQPRASRGGMALQGPAAIQVASDVIPEVSQLARNHAAETCVDGRQALVTRTGYTGEDGVEVFCASEDAQAVWEALWEAGGPYGLAACGLGARDTLRLEAGYPLYGHELSESINPYEAGYGWVVKLEKNPRCIGSEALLRARDGDLKRRTIGLVLRDRVVAREGCAVRAGGHDVGQTTSGTWSPALERPICLALVESGAAGELQVQVRDRWVAADETPLPFYKRQG